LNTSFKRSFALRVENELNEHCKERGRIRAADAGSKITAETRRRDLTTLERSNKFLDLGEPVRKKERKKRGGEEI
jgi:hypothetical protein|tara:strand:- start:409 stop:633 length:225 start_codon:yes stop_codon:yes gene_type:complete